MDWDRESDPSIALAVSMMILGGVLLLITVVLATAWYFVF